MLHKLIDLGHSFPKTGEPRVRELTAFLVKTASSGLQTCWDTLKKTDNRAYLWVIGVSASEYYGCNNNGDSFTEADLIKTHKSFIEHAHIFLHHVNRDPEKSIGKPVQSWYNPDMHRVELILEIRKEMPGAAEIIEKLRNGEQLYVSMGCRVAYDQCSICGNKAPTRNEYCDHLRFNLKKILPDGRQVCALNPAPQFFDISIVRKPADPTAFALDKLASESEEFGEARATVPSAHLGEVALTVDRQRAAIAKFAELVKRVRGDIQAAKDEAGSIDLVRQLAETGFADFSYPELPHNNLERMGLSPAGLALCVIGSGAPLTLGDAAWMASRHFFGTAMSTQCLPHVFSLLPRALSLLEAHPEALPGAVRPVLMDYSGELEDPVRRTLLMTAVRPAAQLRITLVRSLCPEPQVLEKAAAAFVEDRTPPVRFVATPAGAQYRSILQHGEAFAPSVPCG